MRGGVGSRVQRVVHAAVGPHRGHRDDAVVRLAQPAQPLPADVCGGCAVLAVTGVVDHDDAVVVRSRRRLLTQQLEPPVVDQFGLPGRLGQEELQPLHPRHPRTCHRFRPCQAGDRLVPLPRRQEPGQVLAKPSPLGQAEEEVVEPGRVLLQRTRRRRTRTASGHLQPPARQLTPTTGLRPTRPAVNPCHHRIQRTTARRDGGTRSQPRRRPGQARSARRGGNSSTHHRPRHAHLLQPGRTHIHGQSHSTILNALAPASLRPGTAA